jgi:hypothetical protein
MIINASCTQAVSTLGWVHKGSLWVYKIGDASSCVFELSNAKYLTIKNGKDDFFSVVHHCDGDKLEISAHNQCDPGRSISSTSLRRTDRLSARTSSTISGDVSVWRQLPRAYVAFVFDDYHLIWIDRDGIASLQTFRWYSNDNYNKGYQGIVGVEELPDTHLLIVSVQRDSNPILFDPESGKIVRKLHLAESRRRNALLRWFECRGDRRGA